MNQEQTQNSLRKIKAAGERILPGHDGWVRVKPDGSIEAEGGNDKHLLFAQGITVNGGQKEIVLHMD